MSPRRNRHKKSKPLNSTVATSKSSSLPESIAAPSVDASSGKPVRRRFRWDHFKDKLTVWVFCAFIASPIVGPPMFAIIYVPCYRASLKPVEFTVDRRERVVTGGGENTRSYYLVWSKEGEVYCVCDSWSFMSFDSSDRYGALHEGSRITGKVAGWRIPFLSWYRNVIIVNSESLP
jgi:hypothetical protein